MSDSENIENKNCFDLLNDRQQIFVLEYIIDFNASRAARAAGYSEKTARQIGYKLLNHDYIQDAIKQATNDRKARLNIDADKVFLIHNAIATADYNELVQLRRNNCRYCFGDNNEYQWTRAEYENACERAVANNEPEPVCAGGVGFNKNGEPNSKCPECQGEGVESVFIADTTKLSGEANLVYQGVKQGKFGIELVTADRAKSLDFLARALGMYKDNLDITSGGNEIKAGLGHFYGEDDDDNENQENGEADT